MYLIVKKSNEIAEKYFQDYFPLQERLSIIFLSFATLLKLFL